jgi:hypothetical protein
LPSWLCNLQKKTLKSRRQIRVVLWVELLKFLKVRIKIFKVRVQRVGEILILESPPTFLVNLSHLLCGNTVLELIALLSLFCVRQHIAACKTFHPRKVFPEDCPLKTSANIFKLLLSSGKILSISKRS